MIFKWRRKIFGSFHRLLTYSYMFIWGIIYSAFYARWASSSYLEAGLSYNPSTPQHSLSGLQDLVRVSSPIPDDCFSGNTVTANGTDAKSSGGGSYWRDLLSITGEKESVSWLCPTNIHQMPAFCLALHQRSELSRVPGSVFVPFHHAALFKSCNCPSEVSSLLPPFCRWQNWGLGGPSSQSWCWIEI